MCLLWLHGDPDRERLVMAFAEVMSMPVESVDVQSHEVIERNGEAPVLCTVTALIGDVRQHLDIYFAESVGERPSTEKLTAALAERLGCAIAYEIRLPSFPDYYWLVGTDGRRARADINEVDHGDDEQSSYWFSAVEHPVAGAPGLDPLPWQHMPGGDRR
ncbi:hypothetical protein [Actinoplanes couchii]|uniref:Uncharacterized protein n=1 Tax=Actinoplanes couchii TaxID=403638 RepID=A0ABQ3XGQ1_9ACTN|nr:hypothetical protein [Actinoplanes couchii]MDR6320835.1 hypothetical protein [Actinoplanes couchii]GID57680.1 hypothetical protein Aco03nite_060840 [Actinoplanes couchii]